MRNQMILLLLTLSLHAHSQELKPTVGPVHREWGVYGPNKSLIGVCRYWNPTYFYPLHPELRDYIHKDDRKILETPWRLDSLLVDLKYQWVRHADTFYMPIKIRR